jgi:release factor glutamine methyltransferase
MMFLSRVYDLVHPVLRAARGNHVIIRCLFGLRIPAGLTVQFDPTTLGLKRLLCEITTLEDRSSLEIGIGQGALVSLALARRSSLLITGVDCCKNRVDQSQIVAKANGIEADFFVSDLFDAIPSDRRFDLIFFNPPYVPTAVGKRLQLGERFSKDGDQTWDGGPDGTKVLSLFLDQAKNFLTERGRIVFGVQAVFVPDKLVLSAIHDCGLSVQRKVAWKFLPSVCYVVKPEDMKRGRDEKRAETT